MRIVPAEESDRLPQFSETIWADMVVEGQVISLDVGDRVQEQGEISQKLYFILAGRIRFLRKTSELAVEENFGVHRKRGQTAGNPSAHIPVEKIFSMVVTEPGTRILELTTESVRSLCFKHRDFLDFIITDLSTQLAGVLELHRRERELSADQRIAIRLLELADADGNVEMTQNELATLLGTSRITVAKCLAALEQIQIVERRYALIKVTDTAALRAWSER